MRTLLFLAGSSLRGSVNTRLSAAASELVRSEFTDKLHVDEVDLMTYDLPSINPDEIDHASLQALAEAFAKADGFFISADEYTGAFSTQFRLAMNWLILCETEKRPLISQKPAALVGAAPIGVGGMRGLPAIRHLLDAAGMEVISQQIRQGTRGGPVAPDGKLTEVAATQLLEGALGEVLLRLVPSRGSVSYSPSVGQNLA